MPRRLDNPPNPWSSTRVEWLGPPPEVELEVYEEEARSILSKNDSPDLPFRFSLNPYRGCFHACAYCYARPTHQYLDWGAGTDFDRKIVVKTNAPSLLRAALARRTLGRGEVLAFSGVTDCYQPIEASYGLTRACLEACAEFRQPVELITKGALVERDVALLARLHQRAGVRVWISQPFADDADGRALEPFAAAPTRRFAVLRRLAEAGVPVGVAVAPAMPGLNDHQIPAILEAAREAGADRAFLVLLRLPAEVLPVFESRLREAFPDRAAKVLSGLRAMRGGQLRDSRFGSRMQGAGPRWNLIEQLFDKHCLRLGLEGRAEADFARRDRREQGELF